MDWFSAFLGELFLRTVVGGATLLGLTYAWFGYYALAASVVLPLLVILAWLVADLRRSDFDGDVD